MANKHASLDALFTDIADVIREKTGETGAIAAAQFPSVIRNKLQAAPVGFYVSTPQGYSEFVPITPGQTFYDFINSDKNTGKFRIDGRGLATFLEIYYIDETYENVIVKNKDHWLRYYYNEIPDAKPWFLDENGQDLSSHNASSSVLIEDWYTNYNIDENKFINAGIAANTAANRILVSGDTSFLESLNGEGIGIDQLENWIGKPITEINSLNTFPITVIGDGSNLETVTYYNLYVPCGELGTDYVNVVALLIFIDNISSPESIRAYYVETSVDFDSNNIIIPLESFILTAMTSTPCIVSIIG